MRGNRAVVRNLISGYTWYSKMVMSVSDDSAVRGNGRRLKARDYILIFSSEDYDVM